MAAVENMAEGTGGVGPETAVPTPIEQNVVKPIGRFKYVQELPGFDTRNLERYVRGEKIDDEGYIGLFDPELDELDSEGNLIIDQATGEPKPKLVAKVRNISGGSGLLRRLFGGGDPDGGGEQGDQGQENQGGEAQQDGPGEDTGTSPTPAEGVDGQESQTVEGGTEIANGDGEQAAITEGEKDGGNGNGEGPRGPEPPLEGPRGPEPPRGPEWETSPERGRAIVREIIRLEVMPYKVRYQERVDQTRVNQFVFNSEIYRTNEPYLDQLYRDLQDYTRAVRRVRNLRETDDPWDPLIAYREITEALERRRKGESSETNQLGISKKDRGERPAVLPTEKLNALFLKYQDSGNAEAVEGDMAIWYQEARNLGLLDRADAFFSSFYLQKIQGNIPEAQLEEELIRVQEHAKRSIGAALRGIRTDPRAAALHGIAEAYSTRTYDIFDKWLRGERYTPIQGEFRFSTDMDEVEDTEKYWRPGPYPKMYDFIAKTKKQFIRAKNSFLSMITGGALGESPDELYEHFNNFNEKFRQSAGSQGMDNPFIISSVLEIGGRGFVFGGDYSFESYNMRSANQFLMAMALHKGPQRFVAVARSGGGGVAPHLWKFDYDRRVILLHNPGGSRGQLQNDTVTQHYLHQEIRNILTEEGIGVVLKDYDPRDPRSAAYDPESIRALNIEEAEQAREHALQANMKRIGIHQPVEEFKGLYEGFDTGNTHLINYRTYQGWNDDQLRTLAPALRKSVIIGRVQSLLLPHDGKDKDQLIKVIDGLIAEKRLTARDKRFWEEAYDQSKANFATAFQMVGATGEKARRGGGIYFIDRKDEHGTRFVDNMPVYQAEQFVQYVENRIKIQHANSPAKVRTNAVAQGRADAIKQLREDGFEAKISFPKIEFNTDENSPDFGEVIGVDNQQLEEIDFETATDPENPLNRWLNTTYPSYQPENRHQITNPDILMAAKRRRMRLLRPDLMNRLDQAHEDQFIRDQHENLADYRLVMDPTLNRILSLRDTDMPEGMRAQQAEILISDAAIEASNMGHWRIVRELNEAFTAPDGNPFKMSLGYNMEDYSGIARFIIRFTQYVSSNTKRFARRYAAEIPRSAINVSSMPDQWGQVGVLGAIECFADSVGIMSEQRIASQFAITKWIEQMRIGNMLFGAYVGHVDSEKGFSIEGLFEKPTNNAERITKVESILTHLRANDQGRSFNYTAENDFMQMMLESFDRLWIILKLVRTMESDTRNAQGALDLENQDILKDGKVDAVLLNTIAKNRNTGSSRHTEEQIFNSYIKWLTEGPGAEDYKLESDWYAELLKPTILDPEHKMTRAQWLFRKMGR